MYSIGIFIFGKYISQGRINSNQIVTNKCFAYYKSIGYYLIYKYKFTLLFTTLIFVGIYRL